jgi:hypothetical protein
MDDSNPDRLRDFVFRGLLSLDSLQQLEHTGVYLRDSHRRLGRALAELSFAEFSPQIQDGAEKMARLYVAFFCFENSVRELVAQKLRDSNGDTWWDTKVPLQIRKKSKIESDKNKRTSGISRGVEAILITPTLVTCPASF